MEYSGVHTTRKDQVRAVYALGNFTADEVAEQLGLHVLQVRPVVTVLKKLGELEYTGLKRPNKLMSGQDARELRLKNNGELFTALPPQPESDDPRARLFKMAPEIAKKSDRNEESVRKQLGSMMRQHAPAKVLGALQRSTEADDPLTYARALLRGKRNTGVQDGKAAFLSKGD